MEREAVASAATVEEPLALPGAVLRLEFPGASTQCRRWSALTGVIPVVAASVGQGPAPQSPAGVRPGAQVPTHPVPPSLAVHAGAAGGGSVADLASVRPPSVAALQSGLQDLSSSSLRASDIVAEVRDLVAQSCAKAEQVSMLLEHLRLQQSRRQGGAPGRLPGRRSGCPRGAYCADDADGGRSDDRADSAYSGECGHRGSGSVGGGDRCRPGGVQAFGDVSGLHRGLLAAVRGLATQGQADAPPAWSSVTHLWQPSSGCATAVSTRVTTTTTVLVKGGAGSSGSSKGDGVLCGEPPVGPLLMSPPSCGHPLPLPRGPDPACCLSPVLVPTAGWDTGGHGPPCGEDYGVDLDMEQDLGPQVAGGDTPTAVQCASPFMAPLHTPPLQQWPLDTTATAVQQALQAVVRCRSRNCDSGALPPAMFSGGHVGGGLLSQRSSEGADDDDDDDDLSSSCDDHGAGDCTQGAFHVAHCSAGSPSLHGPLPPEKAALVIQRWLGRQWIRRALNATRGSCGVPSMSSWRWSALQGS